MNRYVLQLVSLGFPPHEAYSIFYSFRREFPVLSGDQIVSSIRRHYVEAFQQQSDRAVSR